MSIRLNHTIVHAHDKTATAAWLAEILGLSAPTLFGPFCVVQIGPTSLDFIETSEKISPRHFAFLVGEDEFDQIFERIKQKAMPYWADPFHEEGEKINHWNGGRGVYFEDPNGHNLEILTQPYS